MQAFTDLLSEVDAEIAKLGITKPPHGLYEPIEYVLSLGGKRIRPLLCLSACQLYNDDYRRAMPAALAIEMFHNFTLLHDDIMDNAPVRRNKPTVHVRWDANTAILSGDAMMIKAYQLLSQADTGNFAMLLDTFSRTAIEVCEGQQYDIEYSRRDDVTLDEYMEMIRLKTSALISGAMRMGAIIGGAPSADIESLSEFAENIGLAFQLQDDLLDTYGDEATFGKAIGGDIMENKKTCLLISAMQNANAQQKKELNYWISVQNPARDAKIAAVRSVYDALSVRELTQSRIDELFDKAISVLNRMDISIEGKIFFGNFAKTLVKRSR